MSEPLVKSMKLRCSVEHAFRTFTAKADLWWPSSHRRFEASKISFDAVEQGQLLERAPSGEIFVFADVHDCEAPNRICLEWHPGKSGHPTEVIITFRQEGAFTNIEVIHCEGKAALGSEWDSRVTLFARGWLSVMNALSHHIDAGQHI